MQIGPVSSLLPAAPADQLAAQQQAAAQRLKTDSQPPPPKAPFQPAPPLRPTVEDSIAIDRALLALRDS